MAIQLSALGRVRRTRGVDLLPDSILVQHLAGAKRVWRERLLPPLVMVRLFLTQILHGNTSIAHLRQLSGIDFAPASYCQARMRLPLCLLRSLLRWTVQRADEMTADRPDGPRVIVTDCSSFSMPDTPALRKQFGLPVARGCKPGVSYPIAKVMALLDMASGCFVRLIPGELYRHEASEVIRLHRHLRKGDVLLADRAFCSYVHIALLSMRGVGACFRLHQRRKNRRPGVQRWDKPADRPDWISPQQYNLLPRGLEVRIVRYRVQKKGHRTRQITLVTTLLDENHWPDEKIAELFGHRWNIETCFNHLKTTMKMNVLRCKSVGGILRELMMYLIVYNLIRLAMLDAAAVQEQEVDRISFIDAMRCLAMRMLGLCGDSRLLINPHRPGRRCPRVIRRRMKEYDLLIEPRSSRLAKEMQR